MGSHSLLQGIFLTQGSDPGLLHCRQILYHLSPQKPLLAQLFSCCLTVLHWGFLVHILSCSLTSVEVKVKSCPTLCDPKVYSLPGSSIHGIFQEWVAIPFSRDWTQVSGIASRCFPIWAIGKPLQVLLQDKFLEGGMSGSKDKEFFCYQTTSPKELLYQLWMSLCSCPLWLQSKSLYSLNLHSDIWNKPFCHKLIWPLGVWFCGVCSPIFSSFLWDCKLRNLD